MGALRLEGEELVQSPGHVGAGDDQEAAQGEVALSAEELHQGEELGLAQCGQSASLSELAGASQEAADEALCGPLVMRVSRAPSLTWEMYLQRESPLEKTEAKPWSASQETGK